MLSFVTGVQEYGSKLHCDFADFQVILTSSTSYCILKERDRPPHGEATAVKGMIRCRTTPALVTANFQILSVARLWKNTNPLSKGLTLAAKATHVLQVCALR